MKPIVKEWVEKAEGDFHSAMREYRAKKHPNYDSACFHAQQCAEKYIKAMLQNSGINFSRTHNLVALLNIAAGIKPMLEIIRPEAVLLNGFAVDYRYPGETADREMARDAVSACKKLRGVFRDMLKLMS